MQWIKNGGLKKAAHAQLEDTKRQVRSAQFALEQVKQRGESMSHGEAGPGLASALFSILKG